MLRQAVGRRSASSEQIAGVLAIVAGICWLTWIAATSFSGTISSENTPRTAKLIQVMIAGWNLLLLPAAVIIFDKFQEKDRDAMRLFTACGIVSLLFWGYGGASGTITPGSEVVYILLSGVWWIGIGSRLFREQKYFGGFTIVLGIFSILDALLSFFEPMPFCIYVLAAPKLPLSIIWDFWVGIYLLRPNGSKLAYASDSIKPRVERSGTRGSIRRKVSSRMRATDQRRFYVSSRCFHKPLTGHVITGIPASVARIRELVSPPSLPRVPLRSTRGSMPSLAFAS